MTEIFTDASVNNEAAVATCFCVDDKMFLGHSIFTSTEIHRSQLGELFGAVCALEYVDNQLGLGSDAMTLYTDSQFLIDILDTDVTWHDDDASVAIFNDYLNKFRAYVATYSIDVKLIPGHQTSHNPNKVVDLISINTLRNTL